MVDYHVLSNLSNYKKVLVPSLSSLSVSEIYSIAYSVYLDGSGGGGAVVVVVVVGKESAEQVLAPSGSA